MPAFPPLRWLSLLALLPFSLLPGCATTQLAVPQVAMPATFPTPGSAAMEQSLDRWWQLFADPQLTSLVEEGLAHSPDSRTALAQLDEAQAIRSQALLAFGPQGDLSASVARQRTDTSGAAAASSTAGSAAFSPSWEIDLFGRRRAARTAADADLAAAGFAYAASRQSLAASIAGNLFEARGLAVALADARDSLRIATELATLAERKAAAGLGTRADAASLEADRAAASDVADLTAQFAVSCRSLLVLLGRGTAALDALPIETSLGEPPAMPGVAPATLLARRPDIGEAEARLRAAIGSLQLDQLALLPRFDLLAGFSRSGVVGGYAASLWSIGAGLALPVFDRTRLLREVRAQRARSEQAAIAYEKAVQTGYGEAESNLATYAADRDRLALLARAEERSRYAFDAQAAGYRAGVVDLTALLTAERSWRANRSALSRLRAVALQDAVNCFRALGGGWSWEDLPRSASVQGDPA